MMTRTDTTHMIQQWRSGGATSNALSSRARSRWPHRPLPTACTQPDRWPDSASPQ